MPRASVLLVLLAGGCLYNKSLYDERTDALTDADGDGYMRADDCDDSNATIAPGADEVPADAIDQDCDGGDTCQADTDGDSFGSAALIASDDLDCDDAGEAADTDDCDPADPGAHPDADEVFYDGVDQNCVPEDDDDADGDGFAAYTMDGTDCDDTDAALHPGLNRTFEVPSTDYPTIQSAIDATCDGDTVHLAGSEFYESFDMGHRDIDVVGEGNTSVRGKDGDAGPVARLSRGSLDMMWIEHHDGTEDGGCIRVEHGVDVYIGASTSSCTTTKDGGGIYVSDTVGITIEHQSSSNQAAGDGGGLYIRDSSDVSVTQYAGDGNKAGSNGGAVYVENVAGLHFGDSDSMAANEAGEAGGALYLKDVTGIDSHLFLFIWNRSVGVGSSVAMVGASEGRVRDWAVIDSFGAGQAALYLQGHLDLGNLFVLRSEGAGIHVVPNAGDEVTLQNLLLLSNANSGLVVQSDEVNTMSIVNSIVAYNGGYGLLSTGTASPSVRYSDLYDNALGNYSGLDLTGTYGNLSVDPGFLQYPSTLNVAASEFLLAPDSPLIDVGDPTLLDPDGSRSDMGMWAGPDGYAFEYYEDLDDDGMYDGWESEYGVDPSRDDAAEDPDGDHLTNLEEFGIGTIPTSFDSDNDGTPDAIEVDNGFDPIDSEDAPAECSLSLYAGSAPVAWFALDDASGAVLADGIGDLDATVTGGVTDAEGKVDRAALFDGATGFATAAVPATASSFAWAAWVRVDTLPASDLAVVAAHGLGPEPDTGWMLAVDAAGIPRFVLEGGSSVDRQVLLGWEVAPGAWTHFAISFEDGIANMYQDGNHVRRVETPFPAVTFGTNPFTLGYDPSASGRWFAGAVDQVAYWNTSLAHSDVYGLVNDDTCDLASF